MIFMLQICFHALVIAGELCFAAQNVKIFIHFIKFKFNLIFSSFTISISRIPLNKKLLITCRVPFSGPAKNTRHAQKTRLSWFLGALRPIWGDPLEKQAKDACFWSSLLMLLLFPWLTSLKHEVATLCLKRRRRGEVQTYQQSSFTTLGNEIQYILQLRKGNPTL